MVIKGMGIKEMVIKGMIIKGIVFPLQPSQPKFSHPRNREKGIFVLKNGEIWSGGALCSPKNCSSSSQGNANSPALLESHKNVDLKEELGEGSSSSDCFPALPQLANIPRGQREAKKQQKKGISCADTAPAPAWKNFPIPCSPLAFQQHPGHHCYVNFGIGFSFFFERHSHRELNKRSRLN